MDHFILGQLAAAHRQQRADPSENGQAVAEEHGHVEHTGGRRITGLRHGGGITDERHTACRNGCREGGHNLVHQAVGAADHSRDVLAAAVQLIVNDIRHESGIGCGDAHGKAVDHKCQDHKGNHGDAHVCNGLCAHGMTHNHKERDHDDIGNNAVACPGHNGFLVAVLAGILCTIGCKENGRQHADHAQRGGQAHIADENAVEHGADNGCRGSLLGDFIGSGGENIALQGLIALEHVHHVAHLEAFIADALEVFRLVIFCDADADQHHTDKGNGNAQPGGDIQEFLVEASAHRRHQFGIHHNVQGHRGQIVENRLPDTHGGTLFGIIGHQGRQRLGRHVDDRVADDVDQIEQKEHRNAVTLAGEEVEHAQQSKALDHPADEHQRTDFAPAGIEAVIHKGQQRVCDGIKDTGEGQKTTDHDGSNAVTDGSGVAGKADQKIHCHAVESIEGHENNLPEFGFAILNAVVGNRSRLYL